MILPDPAAGAGNNPIVIYTKTIVCQTARFVLLYSRYGLIIISTGFQPAAFLS
jgi:hypothetical protein